MRLNKLLVKLVIMVKPYNASMINYIEDNYWKNQFKWDWLSGTVHTGVEVRRMDSEMSGLVEQSWL